MMQEKPDRRIRRTNRALATALIDLTAERSYPSIQVRDITDRADVGYATFYRHYDSKDELMLAVFEDITEELETSAGEQGLGYFEREGTLIFGHVQKYRGFYRSIIQSPEFVKKLQVLLAQRIEAHIIQHLASLKDPAFPLELAAHHMVVALIGLIEWWLEKEMGLSISEMSGIYDRLIIQATWSALDSSKPLSTIEHS
jgi:AcrR family transcriptional regulator